MLSRVPKILKLTNLVVYSTCKLFPRLLPMYTRRVIGILGKKLATRESEGSIRRFRGIQGR
jgi:hypothetical protein